MKQILCVCGWVLLSMTVPATAADSVPTGEPSAAQKRVDLLKWQPLLAPTIFSDEKLPKIDFVNFDLVKAAIGPYTVQTRFFDAKWNEVTTAKTPGRYGAMIEVHTADGLSFSTELDLYRTPQRYRWAQESYGGMLRFPSAFGVPDEEATREKWNINNAQARVIGSAEGNDDYTAATLGALQDLREDPARWRGFSIPYIDNVWWCELRRRLGENQDYPYVPALPMDYDKDKKAWPLIVFLHGSGERGTDLSLLKNQGPLGYINEGHTLPFVVIEPQCPNHEHWDCARLARLLDTVEAKYRIDPKRVYVTGLSLGGYASFELAANYPDRIAAIAPLSGGENPGLAQRLRKMPAWIFHGAEDDVVPPRYSIDLAHAMEKLGAPVKLTLYPGVGHEKWDVTYRDPALYAWFLSQSK